MVKRLTLFFLALISILLCILCKSEVNNLTLTVKKSPWGQEEFEAQETAINNFISEFNKINPDIKVTVNYVQEYPADLKESEIVLLGADEMLEYVHGDLKILSGLVSEDDFSQKILDIGKIAIDSSKKELVFVPFNYDRAVVYADKGLFDLVGVDVPSASWTYDDFKETIQSVTKNGCDYEGYSNSVGIHLPIARTYVWKYFYDNLGDGWYSEETSYVKFNTDNNIKIMEDVIDLYKKNAKCYSMTQNESALDKSITAMAWINACQPEYDDYRVISEEKSYSLLGRRIKSVAEKGNLVLLPLPSINGSNMSYSNTEFIKGFGISKYIDDAKLDNAIKFIEFAKTLAGNSALYEYYGGIPSCENLWSESYWKKGLLAGVNADNVLIGIENDKRDDYVDLISVDEGLYEKNIRLRAICANYLLAEIKNAKKNISSFEKIMDDMTKYFNSTLTVYGTPIGYNPEIIGKE